nr:alcohol dehydrogenase [Staphylococcus hominis]
MKSVTYQGYKNMEVCEVNDPTEIITHTYAVRRCKRSL